MIIERRKFILGLSGLFCAPAIIKFDSLMKVTSRGLIIPRFEGQWFRYGVPIPGATGRTYTVTKEDTAALIEFRFI